MREQTNMDYIKKHWRGELSLGISFWVNLIFINIFLTVLINFIEKTNAYPPTLAGIILFLKIFSISIYPWQIVGVIRVGNRYVAENVTKVRTKGATAARAAQVFVFFSILSTIVNLVQYWPINKNHFQVVFLEDQYANYKIELINDNNIIHLQGGMGFGVSNDVAKILAEYPEVKGIILDSSGGRFYEGRELSKIIKANFLDTYTLNGCYSACATAFIGGVNRYLGTGANLAFHQYGYMNKHLDDMFKLGIEKEQQMDLNIFKSQGVKSDFLDKMYNSSQDDFWYPTTDTLFNAGVIHGSIKPSDIIPTKYQGTLTKDGAGVKGMSQLAASEGQPR